MQFKFLTIAVTCATACCLMMCNSNEEAAKINWDEWGVPHIKARSKKELFFAQGWSQMKLHGDLILQLYGKARGRGAEYWGKDLLNNDVLIHTLGFPELAKKWRDSQDEELKEIITAFITGMNAYAATYPQHFDESNRVVLPIEYDDVNLHYLYVVYTRFIGSKELGFADQWVDKGSNTCAISPGRTTSHHAMLVQNPHLPWFGEFTFTELHFVMEENNFYGASLVGFPGIQIGFNENLGWSHTNNVIDNSDIFSVKKQQNGYLLDENVTKFERAKKALKVKNEKGGLDDYRFEVARTVHGPVVKESENHALAVRMVGFDRPNAFLQWWRMGNAKKFEDFESALKMGQIPFWNVMYADKPGNIFYLFNGLIPIRKEQAWSYWNGLIIGGKSEDIWTEMHPYEDLPKIKNPVQGWLQNANDPPWSSTFPMLLDPNKFPGYFSPRQMEFRPQRSVKMLLEDDSISFDDLVNNKLSTRLEMADRLLDDLYDAIEKEGSKLSQEAGKVLQNWDRQADNGSTGTLLFTEWALEMQVGNQNAFSTQWNENNPLTTPDGLSDKTRAVRALEKVASNLLKKHGKLDIPWGEVCRIKRDSIDLPGNGCAGFFGAYRVAWSGREENNIRYIDGGDSWVGIIEFGEQVNAKVLLSYGNSSQKNSIHNGDQLKLFSQKKLRDVYFYQNEVDLNAREIEILSDGKFKKK